MAEIPDVPRTATDVATMMYLEQRGKRMELYNLEQRLGRLDHSLTDLRQQVVGTGQADAQVVARALEQTHELAAITLRVLQHIIKETPVG